MAYVAAERGVVVKTRVPMDLFDYNSPEAAISIGGEAVMQLVGSRRRLRASSESDASEEASFDFEVRLQREALLESDDEGTLGNDVSSAFATSSESLVAFGAAFAWAFIGMGM